jgi:phosphohistidine phosphatase
MALFLVQHGKSLPKDIDPEKGLSEEGTEDVKRISDVAKSYGIHVSSIKHSGKKRARQTSEMFASDLNPEGGVEVSLGMNPLDDVVPFASTLTPNADIMIVGHLPFMERLTSYLTTGSPDNTVFKFQNGGVVCLDKEPDADWWVIKWTLMPNIG